MPALAISSAPRPDRTFTIGLAIVAVFGAAQLVSVAYYYAQRGRAMRAASQPIVAATPVPKPLPTAVPLKTTVTAPRVALATPSPPPRADQLLEQAKALRDKGDNAGALALLQDASQRDPKNANVFAEMAKIYESMQNYDRANESWRKIQEMGPSAGPLSDLADMKLKIGVAPAPVEAGPGLAGVSPLDAGTTRNDTEGIPDGSTFGITEAKATEAPDPDAETNLTLRISVRKRPNSLVDHTKVKIQVFFYDTENDKEVVLTDADVNYEWVTPKHDWKEANPEILQVTYVRPKNKPISADAALTAAAAAVVPPVPGKKARPAKQPAPGTDIDSTHRKYLGYIVRIYYNDQLQAVRADPTKLLNLFPPPFTAPSQ
jgi:tetratricopeptide (TPR) repeat protein